MTFVPSQAHIKSMSRGAKANGPWWRLSHRKRTSSPWDEGPKLTDPDDVSCETRGYTKYEARPALFLRGLQFRNRICLDTYINSFEPIGLNTVFVQAPVAMFPIFLFSLYPSPSCVLSLSLSSFSISLFLLSSLSLSLSLLYIYNKKKQYV